MGPSSSLETSAILGCHFLRDVRSSYPTNCDGLSGASGLKLSSPAADRHGYTLKLHSSQSVQGGRRGPGRKAACISLTKSINSHAHLACEQSSPLPREALRQGLVRNTGTFSGIAVCMELSHWPILPFFPPRFRRHPHGTNLRHVPSVFCSAASADFFVHY